jgi:hypothetical protein
MKFKKKLKSLLTEIPAETWGSLLAVAIICTGTVAYQRGKIAGDVASKERFSQNYDRDRTYVIPTLTDNETHERLSEITEFCEKHNYEHTVRYIGV